MQRAAFNLLEMLALKGLLQERCGTVLVLIVFRLMTDSLLLDGCVNYALVWFFPGGVS